MLDVSVRIQFFNIPAVRTISQREWMADPMPHAMGDEASCDADQLGLVSDQSFDGRIDSMAESSSNLVACRIRSVLTSPALPARLTSQPNRGTTRNGFCHGIQLSILHAVTKAESSFNTLGGRCIVKQHAMDRRRCFT
jgi:hypothetical protein